jgi:hypothetical protein
VRGVLYLQWIQCTGPQIKRIDRRSELSFSLDLFLAEIHFIRPSASKDPDLFVLERASNDGVAEQIESKATTAELRSGREMRPLEGLQIKDRDGVVV